MKDDKPNQLMQKQVLQLIHDYQSAYVMFDEIFKEEAAGVSNDFKMGWMAAVDRLTKDLMGMIVGAVELPNEKELHRASLTRLLESWKTENANVHICSDDDCISTNSKPFECPDCHKWVEGIEEDVVKHFNEKLVENRDD